MITAPLLETSIPDLKLHGRGKVRDIYAVGDDLLLVATDRISAFDYVLGSGIPDKGKVLTQLSAFWFERMGSLVPHHMKTMNVEDYPAEARRYADQLQGRSMLCRRTRPVPIECVARGYLAGSGWKEYKASGSVCGIKLPTGLRESEKLPEPIFTPATKATTGHDENISFEHMTQLVDPEDSRQLRDLSLAIYKKASDYARQKGIIIADTKFEFGRTASGITLADEVLTPDSSRFWPADKYSPGMSQESFDKQYVRDYLEEIKWNKQPPAPALPPEVARKTGEKYVEAYRRITGRELDV